MTSETHPHYLVRFAAEIAAALETIRLGADAPVGFYVEKVTFGYDGETHRGITVTPDEFGGYGVTVDGGNR